MMWEGPTVVVDEVVVEASQLPPRMSDAVFAIKRLDQAALAQAPRLDEALTADPGVSLYRRNSSLSANPTTQGVSLRGIAGSGASRSLVTLDGAPVNDPFGGWVIWSALPAAGVQSAEIVKGAGAGPYGAGALTGVIALQSRTAVPDGFAGEASVGALADERAQGVGLIRSGATSLLATAAAESSGGYIPVRQGRGAADGNLTLYSHSASGRLTAELNGSVLAARVGVYEEQRSSGLVGAASRASGLQSSLALARAPDDQGLGWRLQAWANVSDLSNASVSVAANRASATPANDEYATPASEVGANAALRGRWRAVELEAGVDVRDARGEDRELFKWGGAGFTKTRKAGGDTGVAGAYVEASAHPGKWLLAAGARIDGWGSWNGRRIETVRGTGAVTLDEHPGQRTGVEPTVRLGARRDLGGGLYMRTAAYEGFRPATLNELYRPYRVGNNVTEANAGLTPERLYGVEAGVGAGGPAGEVSATVFYNKLKDAVINATLARGPYTDPVEGFIPAGGTLYQRRNVGAIEATGLEAEAWRAWGERFKLEAALSWTDAEVDGGSAAPQLTGKRPAETPRLSAVGTVMWRPLAPLVLRAQLRLESARWADDLNRQRLAPDALVDVRADWALSRRLGLFLAADNLFDAGVQTDRTAATPTVPSVVSWGAPAQVRVGLLVR